MMKIKGSHTIRDLLLDGRTINRAMQKAVREALLRHKRAGVPAVIWRNGEVIRIRPAQIKVREERSARLARSSRARKASRSSK